MVYFPPHKDCCYRKDRICRITGKNVVLDVRNKGNIRCYNRYTCEHYKAVE